MYNPKWSKAKKKRMRKKIRFMMGRNFRHLAWEANYWINHDATEPTPEPFVPFDEMTETEIAALPKHD